MDRFDRYYKSKNLGIREDLVNTYIKYDNRTLLITNGYSIVHTKTICSNFKENIKHRDSIIRYYDHYKSKENELMLKLDINKIKDGLDSDKIYRFSRDFGLNYMQLKKITDIIGCLGINVLSKDNFDTCFIEIIGRKNQVGYLLPCRIY